MTWQPITRPPGLLSPAPITLRVQTIPARRYFPDENGGGKFVHGSGGLVLLRAA